MNTLDLFKRLPHLDEDRRVTEDRGYTPCLYHLDGEWHVSWVNCLDRYTIEDFHTETPEEAIKYAFEWCIKNNLIEPLITPKFKVGDRIRHKCEKFRDERTIISYGKGGYWTSINDWIDYENQDNFELVPSGKFDISTLIPFESKVLVRAADNQFWRPAIWGVKHEDWDFYCVLGGEMWEQCIPYEGNEHLLGKEGDCSEYYKTWKKY